MSYLVLARKWRPQRFEEVVGQHHVTATLANALKTGRLSHAYLFSGPRGVGKTSVARILAKAINCAQGPTNEPCNECEACRAITQGHCIDVLEIDGASNRGIDDVRQLRESVKYAPASVRAKVYIIDEVHMLTTDAFNALLKTLEEPPRHVYFVLATTEPLRVPPTILSRCQRHDFGRLTVEELVAHLERIGAAEQLAIDREALRLIARKAEGSVRDTLTLLDQVAATGEGPFTAARVQEILGLSGSALYFEISAAITAGDVTRALTSLDTAYQEGLNLQELTDELVPHFRGLLLATLGPEMESLIEGTAEERAQLIGQGQGVRPADALRWLRILLDVAARMRRSAHARVHLEVALSEMAALPRSVDLASVLEHLRKGTLPSSAPAPPVTAAPRATAGAERGPAPETIAQASQPPNEYATAWGEVVARVRREKAFLGSCLHESVVTGFAEGCLLVVLADANGFKREQVEKPSNRRYILRVIEETLGRPAGLRVVEATGSRAAAPAESPPQEAGATQKPRTAGRRDRVREIADLIDGDIIGPAT